MYQELGPPAPAPAGENIVRESGRANVLETPGTSIRRGTRASF